MAGLRLSWNDFLQDCNRLADKLGHLAVPGRVIWGIPTGGCFVGRELARIFGTRMLTEPDGNCFVVDDLVDSGRTMDRYSRTGRVCAALYRKPGTPEGVALTVREVDGWVVFPWEQNHPQTLPDSSGPTDAVVRILQWIGEDPNRQGLRDTPDRVLRALREMTAGRLQSPGDILKTTFEVSHDEMVVLRNVSFTSVCEHHLLPFVGRASVGYIPCLEPPRVVGLSKLARLVGCFATRLQVQERMTQQIADALQEHLQPVGVGVIVEATHQCMVCRGVRQQDAVMVTSAVRGAMKDSPSARAEWLRLAGC